jgi:hypothetical protein
MGRGRSTKRDIGDTPGVINLILSYFNNYFKCESAVFRSVSPRFFKMEFKQFGKLTREVVISAYSMQQQ